MPINPGVLGPQLVVASGTTDPIGTAGWLAIAGGMCTSFLSVVVNATGGTPLVAVGPVITGTGSLVPAVPGAALGVLLAASAGSVDPAGISQWIKVANALVAWVATGGINPSTLVGFVGLTPGPVSGVAQLNIPGKADLATAAGIQPNDAQGKAHWDAVATAIATHLNTLALVTPAMTNPGTGGPVVGTGTVS